MSRENAASSTLYWQSKLLLLLVVPPCSLYLLLGSVDAFSRHDPVILQTLGISMLFGLVVWFARAATAAAAFTGALITACIYLRTPGWHSALFPLLAALILTLAATRIGRTRKEQVGTAEEKHGRSASQVAANLGVAALACLPLTATQLFNPSAKGTLISLVALGASLAETTADTLSSELGIVFGGEPRLITTFQKVSKGTDGGVTLGGTVAGCLGAAIVAAVTTFTLQMKPRMAVIIFASGVFGLFADSLIGATLERRGWLNNDAVNFLSTLAAALLAGRLAAF